MGLLLAVRCVYIPMLLLLFLLAVRQVSRVLFPDGGLERVQVVSWTVQVVLVI